MSLQPSASKSHVFCNCSYAFDPSREIPTDSGSAASRYGSAFHEVLATCIIASLNSGEKPIDFASLIKSAVTTWRCQGVADELAGHVWSSFGVLRAWLMGKNPWALDFSKGQVRVEKSYAINLRRKQVVVRETAAPTVEEHRYELEPYEMGATCDVEISMGNACLTLDHKTGSSKDFSSPSEDDQMKTLGLMQGDSVTGSNHLLAINHADRRGLPMIYAEEISSSSLDAHRKRLRKAMLRVGDGSMTPGPWCKTCPARTICPTQFANLIPAGEAVAEQLLDASLVKAPRTALTSATTVGKAHYYSRELRRLLDKLDDEVRAWCEAHPDEVAVRPDGKSLEFLEREYESLSKTSVVEALGKLEGERLIEKLRKLGVVKKGSRKELHAVAERG